MTSRVLVVDDLPENCLMLEGILEDTYTVDIAENGQQALALLQAAAEKPSLVLSDINMPKMDGFALLSAMKNDSVLRNIPVMLITASHVEEAGLSAGAIDFITKPFNQEIVRLRVGNQIELARYRENLEVLVEEKAGELIATKETFLETMAAMIEYRSLESGEHIKRTKYLTEILVRQLLGHPKYGPALKGMNPEIIAKAAPLHDVGKIGIPDVILLKAGRLTPDEFKIIETHTTIGSEMIATMMTDKNDDYLRHCYDIARFHHERWNGKGYPDKLAGEDIPLAARIVALVDVYDALVSERCYKKSMAHETAIDIIVRESGAHFDPVVVEAMLAAQDKFKQQ